MATFIETSLGVSFETYLRRRWDEQKDAPTSSSRLPITGWEDTHEIFSFLNLKETYQKIPLEYPFYKYLPSTFQKSAKILIVAYWLQYLISWFSAISFSKVFLIWQWKWQSNLPTTPWAQDVNWTYMRRSEDVQDFFWASYVRSIYVVSV